MGPKSQREAWVLPEPKELLSVIRKHWQPQLILKGALYFEGRGAGNFYPTSPLGFSDGAMIQGLGLSLTWGQSRGFLASAGPEMDNVGDRTPGRLQDAPHPSH